MNYLLLIQIGLLIVGCIFLMLSGIVIAIFFILLSLIAGALYLLDDHGVI